MSILPKQEKHIQNNAYVVCMELRIPISEEWLSLGSEEEEQEGGRMVKWLWHFIALKCPEAYMAKYQHLLTWVRVWVFIVWFSAIYSIFEIDHN